MKVKLWDRKTQASITIDNVTYVFPGRTDYITIDKGRYHYSYKRYELISICKN